LKEDTLFAISKELSVSKCAKKLSKMVNMICSRLSIHQDVIKINNQEFPDMGYESYKSTRGVG